MAADAGGDAFGLERLTVNAGGNVAPALPPRAFYVRAGNASDADVVREVFEDFGYDVARAPGGTFNAARLQARYARILAEGKIPLVVDAGAMIGASAVYHQLIYPQSIIAAVEPEGSNFALLRRNCSGLNVRPIEGAIAAETGTLFVSDPGNGHFGFRTGASGFVEVPAFSIPEILDGFDRNRFEPFLCKINIEGGEAELFSRDADWLDAFAAVEIELHDWMLPGRAVSRNFFAALGTRNFDFTYRTFCAFCFNNDALDESEPAAPATNVGSLVRSDAAALGTIDGAMVTGFGDGRCETAAPYPLPRGCVLNVAGWAADPVARTAGRGLVAQFGAVRLDVSFAYGVSRGDVAAALGGTVFERTGFDLDLDAAALPEGTLDLELAVIGADGRTMFPLPERIRLQVGAR